MSEMVERVAKALLRAHYERGRGIAPDWDAIDRFQREMWMFSARAAIEAMREPTVEMLVSAYTAVGVPQNPVLANGYRAMIDEALK